MAKLTSLPASNFQGLTAKNVADLFGISQMAVSHWASRDGCPRNVDGTFDLATVIRWKVEQIEASAKKSAERTSKDENNERLVKARADRAELELAARRGELLDRAEVERGRVERIAVLKASLLALPRQLAPSLEGMERREIQQLLKDRLEEMIRNYAGKKVK